MNLDGSNDWQHVMSRRNKLELPISVNLCLIVICKSNKKRGKNENLNEIGAELVARRAENLQNFPSITKSVGRREKKRFPNSRHALASMIKSDKRKTPFLVHRKRNLMFSMQITLIWIFLDVLPSFIRFIEFAFAMKGKVIISNNAWNIQMHLTSVEGARRNNKVC